MERLSVKTADDFNGQMGHSLGYWPHESLVCVTVDDRRMGATLLVDLPSSNSDAKRFVDLVHYISTDTEATGVVFGIFTRSPWFPGDPRPHEAVMECLTGRLSEEDILVRDGWFIGEKCFTNYLDMVTKPVKTFPLDRLTGSELNAEPVFRGFSISVDPGFRIPVLAQLDLAEKIVKHVERIEDLNPPAENSRAHTLWSSLLERTEMPSDDHAAEMLADFKFMLVRDRLLGDIPGLNDRLGEVLLAQTDRTPHWQRVDRATDLLLHFYSRSDRADAADTADTADTAPVLTSLGVIQWWAERGSRDHECFQRALKAGPNYRLTQLSDQMVSAGTIAPWAMDRNAAYRPPISRGPGIEGLGMA